VTNHALTGAYLPTQAADPPAGGTQISQAVNQLSPYTVPRFTSSGARDSAYNAWAAAGNTIVDDMVCVVSGQIQVRRSGAWVGVPGGRVGSASFNSNGPTSIGGTEQMFDTVTFPAISGRRYRLTWDGVWVDNSTQITAAFTVRTSSGSSVSTSGTLHYSRLVRAWAPGEFLDKQIITELSGLGSGTYTVGIGAKVALGSGTIKIPGTTDNLRKTIVEDIGS
jgi:hypothetical protein